MLNKFNCPTMKISTKALFALFFLLTTLSFISAQQLSTSDILGDTEGNSNIEELDQKEAEREGDFLNQLLLNIPEITDNPSHIITFIDPSEERKGVQLEIDGKSFQDITSPYSLPALSIGKHELRFKFVDKYGATQILEKDIVVIPRPPIINSPSVEEEFLIISGTGLSNSEIMLILSTSRKIFTKEDIIDGDGNWEFKISKDELSEGLITFTGYTRRYGYASNLAESVTFELGQSQNILFSNGKKDIHFKFKDIAFSDINSIISNNMDLVILIIATFTLGFVLSFLLFSLFKNNLEEKKIKFLEKKISENGKSNKDITLKEKLSQSEPKKEEKKPIKEEKKKEERIVTKIDFLKDFKMFDPDDEKGEEKENIKVTVTSKD
jgi:hypothetical protein